MSTIKISELPQGTAENNAIVPVTNAAGTETVKVTLSDIASLAPVESVAGKTGVVTLDKNDVGLNNVDNTSDADKPVSMAQATADSAVADAASSDATTKANAAQAYAIQRANHTGTQAISTVDGLQTALDGKSATSHTHDDRYYNESEVDTLLAAKQTAGNYAALVNGTVPASQLPSYVDDVVEVANLAALSGLVADSSFGAAAGTYSQVGNYADSPYYAGSNSNGSSNGWLMYFDADLFGWVLSQTNTPGVDSFNGYSANGDPDTAPLTGWFSDTVNDLTLTATSGEVGKIYVTLDNNKAYRWSGSTYVEISASPGSTDAVPEGSVNLYYTNERASAAAPIQSVAGKTGVVTLDKNDITDFDSSVSNLISTDVLAGDGITLTYDSIEDRFTISATEKSKILSLGSISGINQISFDTDRLIQTLALNGTSTTFSKGSNWPSDSTEGADIVLRITVTSATSITWSIVTDWFSQPPAGALAVGVHLFLLRSIGSSVIEGHYIGSKTN